MPRKHRIHYPAAIYHVMLRGNNKAKIFYAHEDYEIFYKYLNHVIEYYDCKIHFFCLMTNHVHLVIEIKTIPLSKIMQSLTAAFTMKMNRRYKRCGHLFQGRYKAKVISDDEYFLALCYYIHQNPVNAKIVKELDEYQWSSHLCYLNKTTISFLYMDHTRKLLDAHVQKTAENKYAAFIYDRNDVYTKPTMCSIDADGLLVITDSVNDKIRNNKKVDLRNISLQRVIKVVCENIGVDDNDLPSVSSAQKLTRARALIAYYAHYHGTYLMGDIAIKFARNPESFSKTVHRNLKKITVDKAFFKIMKRIERQLSSGLLEADDLGSVT